MSSESFQRTAWFSSDRSWQRRILFRLGALLMGCLPLATAEILCRCAGWGQPDYSTDPFVGFSAVRPLFERTPDGSTFHISPQRRGFFKQDSFAARKPNNEFRIFVFGGSTVQGNPFSTETSFAEFLRRTLQTMAPDRSWDVVNCGGVSYASYRLLPVMEECFQYEPDLYIFCEGQNEFLEDVTYSGTRRLTPVLEPLLSVARHLQSVRSIVNGFSGTVLSENHEPSSRPLLPEDVQTLLDQSGGLDRYHRDDAHTDAVVRHFRFNLERMVALCRQKKVPLLLIQPPVNLSDCPPFKSQFSRDTSAEQQAEILQTLRDARKCAQGDAARALTLMQSIVRQQPRYALGWYELGQIQLTIGDLKNALISLNQALDEDVCPLRMKTALSQAMQQVAATHNIPFLNAHALLGRRCRGGIVGEQVLVDHVHPSFRGHEDIAVEIAVWMEQQKFVQSQAADWQQSARDVCRQAVQQLDDTYFLRGRRALHALRQWAAGRALEPDMVHSADSELTTTASDSE